MNFIPHGPFEMPRKCNDVIESNKHNLNKFWSWVEEKTNDNLSGAIGCYIFSIRAGKGALPWYIGKAEKQSFRKECFADHKLKHYSNALANRIGTPFITLIAKYTPTRKIVSPTGNEHQDIQFLENVLISYCIRRNPDLLNIKDTKLLKEMTVRGLLNSPKGKVAKSVLDFKELIGS